MGEKNNLQSFEGKMCKNVCFCAEKTRFCRTGEATVYELLLCTKYKLKKTQFLAKISRSDNFVKHFLAGFVFNFFLFLISKLLTFLSQNENKQTTCSKIANANFVGLSLAYLCFLLNYNDFTTVNFNKITVIIIGKHFKISTNTVSCLRLGDFKPIVTCNHLAFESP